MPEISTLLEAIELKLLQLDWIEYENCDGARVAICKQPRLLAWMRLAILKSGIKPETLKKLEKQRHPRRIYWLYRQLMTREMLKALLRNLEKQSDNVA